MNIYLAMYKGGNGHIPGGVSGHAEAEKRPDSVVMKGRDEHSGGTASTKNISPCSLIQSVVDVVNVTVLIRKNKIIDFEIKQTEPNC